MLVNKEQAIAINSEIEKAVLEILKKHNLQVGKIRTKYGDEYSFSINAVPLKLNESGVNVNSLEAQNWAVVGSSYGFENPEAVLGVIFTANKKEYKFTGVNTRKEKFPVTAIEVSSGKSYGFPAKVLSKLPNFEESKVATWVRSEFGLGYEVTVVGNN